MSNNRLTDMYTLMSILSELGAPIVFKGALVLNALLNNKLNRETKDIDANCVTLGTQRDLDLIIKSAVSAAKAYNLNLTWKRTRAFDVGKAAKYAFYTEKGGQAYFTLDVAMRSVDPFVKYRIAEFSFMGISPQTIVGDKVSALSTPLLIRRVKDMYDIYLLSYVGSFTSTEILFNITTRGRKLEDFSVFKTHVEGKAGLRHAYAQLNAVKDKPDFDVLYSRVYAFLQVFFTPGTAGYTWCPVAGRWDAKI